MKRLDGSPPVSSPRESFIDEDILYRLLGCLAEKTDRQFIFCTLEQYPGDGYVCLNCGAEQPMVKWVRKKMKKGQQRR